MKDGYQEKRKKMEKVFKSFEGLENPTSVFNDDEGSLIIGLNLLMQKFFYEKYLIVCLYLLVLDCTFFLAIWIILCVKTVKHFVLDLLDIFCDGEISRILWQGQKKNPLNIWNKRVL